LDDNFPRAARATGATRRLDFLLAHRPGFILPTLAARKLATLDHFTGGRPRVHFVTGKRDAEPQRDGDCLAHDERHARTDEYLDILRRVCTSPTPIDHAGAHYRFAAAFSELKPPEAKRIIERRSMTIRNSTLHRRRRSDRAFSASRRDVNLCSPSKGKLRTRAEKMERSTVRGRLALDEVIFASRQQRLCCGDVHTDRPLESRRDATHRRFSVRASCPTRPATPAQQRDRSGTPLGTPCYACTAPSPCRSPHPQL
jgi:hypothetical protein